MKNKKTITLTLIGLFIFLFSIVGLTYAYWSRTLTQSGENLVYTDCLKLDVNWGTEGFTLNDAYPMTNKELVSDFFPKQTPYHFTITNTCEAEVPISINMESLTSEEEVVLKDEYVDIILWEDESTDYFNQGSDKVLSFVGSRMEFDSESEVSSYKLTDNKVNDNKILTEANTAYQLHTFKLKGHDTKVFSLLLFMDYDTPVDGTEVNGEIVRTNNAHWRGKITLNNYEAKPTLIEIIKSLPVQQDNSGNSGIYLVDHTEDEFSWVGTEDQIANLKLPEYRFAGFDPNNYVDIEGQIWRIIGLVNTPEGQRVKLIKDESIGKFSWDTSASNVNGGYGVNEWSESDLMKLLNPDYDKNEKEEDDGSKLGDNANNSLYWNGEESGNCYNDQNNKTIACNFTDNKMLNSLKNMIDTITWNTGSNGSEYTYQVITGNDFYKIERSANTADNCKIMKGGSGGNMCNDDIDRKTSWEGKVGLIYPSDYLYAIVGNDEETRQDCLAKDMLNLGTSKCFENNWLNTRDGYWTLMPFDTFDSSNTAFFVFHISKIISGSPASNSDFIRPSVYLEPNILVVGDENDGSYEKPYILKLE